MHALDSIPEVVAELVLHLGDGPDALRISELPDRLQDADVLQAAENHGLVQRIAVRVVDLPRVYLGFHPQTEQQWRASYARAPARKAGPPAPTWVPAGAEGSHVELTAKGRRLIPELRLARTQTA